MSQCRAAFASGVKKQRRRIVSIGDPRMNAALALVACLAIAAGVQPSARAAAPLPFPPLPNAAQLRWHKAEYIMFIHWGMKTFYPSANHMGSGLEDPQRFNPVKLDPAQWARVAKQSGFKGIVFTTKHHDGFCNWATATTDHCVRSAAWKQGRGDVVGELVDACRKEGIYFGLYVSLRDNHYEAVTSKSYAGYDDYYYRQLKELSSNYGPLDEYWFDGFASGGVKIDYAKLAKMIRTKQPGAVVYDSGTLVKYLPDRCLAWPGAHGGVRADQVYRRNIDDTLRWYPNEGSLILQGNWFHCGQPAVSVETMKEDYLNTVGHGVTPLMNVPPNKDGLIDGDTIAKLRQFKRWVDELAANNLAMQPGVKVTGTAPRGGDPRFAPDRATDGDSDTYFAPEDDVRKATIEVKLPRPQKIDGFVMQEPIALGQRITGYRIECHADNQWTPVFSGRTIGYKRIILAGHSDAAKLRLPVADGVRLVITDSLACPLVSNFQIVGGQIAALRGHDE
jgi:alpha-L-fucosidase